MLALVVFLVCVVVAVGTVAILYQLGVIPGSPAAGSRSSAAAPGLPFGGRTPLQQAQRDARELPQGCLVTMLVVATVWFLLWGIVLVVALRFLSDPYG